MIKMQAAPVLYFFGYLMFWVVDAWHPVFLGTEIYINIYKTRATYPSQDESWVFLFIKHDHLLVETVDHLCHHGVV